MITFWRELREITIIILILAFGIGLGLTLGTAGYIGMNILISRWWFA